MKKSILILITAVICSFSYAQLMNIDIFKDTVSFTIIDSKADLLDRNSLEPWRISEDRVIYKTNYSCGETIIPTTVTFNLVNDTVYEVIIIFLYIMNTDLYTLLYENLTHDLEIYTHLKIEQNEKDTIFPKDAYTLLENNLYKFTQCYDYTYVNCYMIGSKGEETVNLYLLLNDKPFEYSNRIEIESYNKH